MTDSAPDQLRHKHQMVWDALRELGIKHALVEFSGSGDSGQIDDCYPEGSDGYGVFATKTLTVDTSQPSILLRDLMIELSDEILWNDEIPDWYNNDGGYGVLEWIVAHTDKEGTHHTDRIAVTVNVAVVDYDTSNFEYDGFGNRAGAE
jgi:uncharacterized protein DUF6878